MHGTKRTEAAIRPCLQASTPAVSAEMPLQTRNTPCTSIRTGPFEFLSFLHASGDVRVGQVDCHIACTDAQMFSALAGTSAGGLATFLHADSVPSFFNSTRRFAFLPDAGVFLDHKNMQRNNSYRERIISGLQLWNASSSLNPSCVTEWQPYGKEWHCLLADKAFRHFKTRGQFFVLNSMYDRANIDSILQLGCDPSKAGSCSPQQLEAFQEYHNSMRDALTELCADGLRALFVSSCFQHEESCQNADWTQLTVNKVSLQQAVFSWYFEDKAGIYLDSVSWPNNESCVKNITHGPC